MSIENLPPDIDVAPTSIIAKCAGCERMSEKVINANSAARLLVESAGLELLGGGVGQVGKGKRFTYEEAETLGLEKEYADYCAAVGGLRRLKAACRYGGLDNYNNGIKRVECGTALEA